jgi:hypothetical protein
MSGTNDAMSGTDPGIAFLFERMSREILPSALAITIASLPVKDYYIDYPID